MSLPPASRVPLAPLTPLVRLVGRRVAPRLERWSTASQLGARRNAMVGATHLAQRRAEREEVEDYFAARAADAAARDAQAAARAAHG